ncbi:hypothetical protein SeLEV6574_g08597, partial [Synchytrium endobioticum]
MIHLLPTNESITAAETAKLVFNHVVCKHGVPKTIITDRGPQFKSHLWKELLRILGSKASLSTSYHPQTDGQSERTNQEIEQYLRTFSSYNQNNWASLLPQAEFCHNNSIHRAIGMSPFFAVTGQDAIIGTLEEPAECIKSSVPDAGSITERFKTIHQQLNQQLETARKATKYDADKRRKEGTAYKIGDEVMISTKNVRTDRPTKKLDYRWIGPYYIKRLINPVTYEVELPKNLKIHPVFHASLLKSYHRSTESGHQLPKPPPLRVLDDDGYVIEDIVDVRKKGRG